MDKPFDFHIIKSIGKGAYATVYLVEKVKTKKNFEKNGTLIKKQYALKILKKE